KRTSSCCPLAAHGGRPGRPRRRSSSDNGGMSDIPALPCYLNGEFSTVRDAKVSVLDRGFIFGDGVYEVVPAYEGRPFRFREHMARLDRSLGELRIANPMDREGWRALVDQLVAAYARHVDRKLEDTNQLV